MMRQPPQIAAGDDIPPASYPVTRLDLIRYAGASGDFNVIHWNERVALEVGLPGVIGHGMLTMAKAAQYVVDWAGDPGAVVDLGVQFSNPVVVPDDEKGADVELSGRVEEVDEESGTATVILSAVCGGQQVLRNARAVVRLRR
jgi:acyl dehydratase